LQRLKVEQPHWCCSTTVMMKALCWCSLLLETVRAQ
jgi:hypothetical protein